MNNATIQTSVIIVTYNSEDDIEACLDYLGERSGLEVVVVDNASTDGTRELLAKLRDKGMIDTLRLSDENLGFAAAVNAGIRTSAGGDIFLLNPDAKIQGAGIIRLGEMCRSDSTIGIIAPLVESGPTVAVMAAGRQPAIWPLFTHFSGLARALPHIHALRGRHLYMRSHSAVARKSSGCPAVLSTCPKLSSKRSGCSRSSGSCTGRTSSSPAA